VSGLGGVSGVAGVLAASLPVHDWQFWVASGLALAAAVYLLSKLVPVPWLSKKRKQRRQRTKATLTIGGKVVR
jgi:hypothetical protein